MGRGEGERTCPVPDRAPTSVGPAWVRRTCPWPPGARHGPQGPGRIGRPRCLHPGRAPGPRGRPRSPRNAARDLNRGQHGLRGGTAQAAPHGKDRRVPAETAPDHRIPGHASGRAGQQWPRSPDFCEEGRWPTDAPGPSPADAKGAVPTPRAGADGRAPGLPGERASPPRAVGTDGGTGMTGILPDAPLAGLRCPRIQPAAGNPNIGQREVAPACVPGGSSPSRC